MSETSFSQVDVDRIVAEKVAAATKPYEGVNADEYHKLKAADTDRQRKALEDKGNYEKLIADQKAGFESQIAQMKSEHKAALDTQKNQLEAIAANAKKQLDAERIKSAFESEATRQGCINPEQVRKLLYGDARVTEDGVIEIVDTEGKPAKKDGKAVTVAEHVDEFLKANAHFVSAGPAGGGSKGPGGGESKGKTMKRSAFEALEPQQRAKVIKEVTIID